jgi:hypothetical protein
LHFHLGEQLHQTLGFRQLIENHAGPVVPVSRMIILDLRLCLTVEIVMVKAQTATFIVAGFVNNISARTPMSKSGRPPPILGLFTSPMGRLLQVRRNLSHENTRASLPF